MINFIDRMYLNYACLLGIFDLFVLFVLIWFHVQAGSQPFRGLVLARIFGTLRRCKSIVHILSLLLVRQHFSYALMAKAPVSYSGFRSLSLGHRFDPRHGGFSVVYHRWSMYVRTKRDVKCAQYVYHWYV